MTMGQDFGERSRAKPSRRAEWLLGAIAVLVTLTILGSAAMTLWHAFF